MLRTPSLYSVGIDYMEDDPHLVQKRADIVHTAAALLEKCQLIKYERTSGRFLSTELGRIASYYYVTHASMQTYNQHLKPTMNIIELFRVFALSNEFKLIPVRQDVSLPNALRGPKFATNAFNRRSSSCPSSSSGYRYPSRRASRSR